MQRYEIRYRKTAELRPNPDNAKIHPAKQLERIKRSIRSFGFVGALVIDDRNIVLCGNGRLAAALELGLEEVPTIDVGNLSEVQRRALSLADNKTAEGAVWDEEKLAKELEAILNLQPEFEISDTGFAIGEIDTLLGQQLAEAVEVVEPPFDPGRVDTVCRPGDLWLLGNHRLFCGTALEAISYDILLGAERAQALVTDPPYNIAIPGVVSGKGNVKHDNFVQASGEMSAEAFSQFLSTFLHCSKAVMADGALAFVFMDWRNIDRLLTVMRNVFGDPKGLAVWDKLHPGMGGLYRNQHELCAIFKSGTAPHVNNVQLGSHGRNRSNVWSFPGMAGFSRGRLQTLALHPTIKNLDLIAEIILDSSNIGSLILDPFAGSGTTVIAAERARRRAALIELDPHYCDVILRRFCDATGIEPINAWTGAVVERKPRSGEKANG